MPATVKVALFTDDVFLINSHHNKAVAKKELQRVVTAVAEWSILKKMVLSADKCELTLFSTNSHEVNWQPTIIANQTRLLHNPRSELLGVTLDRPAHPEHLEKSGCQMQSTRLSRLEGVVWRNDQLRKVYKAPQLSLQAYAPPAWQPCADT